MNQDKVYLRVCNEGRVSFIGYWEPANDLNDNYEAQKDIGWHIFLALQKGADKVEVVIGDQDKDYSQHREKYNIQGVHKNDDLV